MKLKEKLKKNEVICIINEVYLNYLNYYNFNFIKDIKNIYDYFYWGDHLFFFQRNS